MPSTKSRIEALKKVVAQKTEGSNTETDSERIQRENAERVWQKCQDYIGWVEQIISVMEEPYATTVFNELKPLEENWWTHPMCMQEDCLRDENTPLTTAVLAFANALHKRELYPNEYLGIPCQFPATMCEFFIERGHEVFSPERSTWERSVPRTVWLMGNVACEDCNYPVPSRSVGFDGVEKLRDESSESYELPFKRCPCCNGPVAWGNLETRTLLRNSRQRKAQMSQHHN